MKLIPVVLIAGIAWLGAGSGCGGCSGDGVTDCQVQRHPESSLVYPGARDVSTQMHGENNGRNFIQNVAPTPAYAEIQFHTGDGPDRVIDWYDRQLKTRGWEDARSSGSGRYWQRGTSEQASIWRETYLQGAPYDFRYSLRSSRFPPLGPAAFPIGDPVSVEAVQSRDAGIQDYFGVTATADGAAATTEWSSIDFAYDALRLASRAESEQVAPPRAAYRLLTFQIPEYYDKPERMDQQGHLEKSALQILYEQGFKQLIAYTTSVAGVSADEFIDVRGDREVYELAIGYGPVRQTTYRGAGGVTLSALYRVATVSVVYAILPRLCGTGNPDCISLVPAPNSAVGP